MFIPQIKKIVLEKITLRLTGLACEGFAFVTDWYGNKNYIEMESYTVKDFKDIEKKINDNGLGSQSIDGAYVHIYPTYGNYIDYNNKIDCIEYGKIDAKLYDHMIEKELF